MCLNKARMSRVWGALKSLPTLLERCFLYLFIFTVPLLYYPLMVDGRVIDLRKIREIGFYSFAIIVCSFLQKSRWLRYFIIWCVVNWWLNFFWPNQLYVGLTNVFGALVLYIGLKHLIKKGFLSVDVILKLVCVAVLFQFAWLIMQMFDYDPLAWWKYGPGFYAVGAIGQKLAGFKVPLVSWSGNASVLGVFFACTSFLLLYYFRVKKIPILFFLILSSVFIVKNATTAICFTGGGVFYLLNRYRFRLKFILIGILVLLLLGAFLVHIKTPNFDRLPIWKKLICESMELRPVVGKGLNFFSYLYIVDKTGTSWKEAHNDYLQMILELGILGFILFSGFIVSRFVLFFREKRDNKQIAIASCLLAYLISGVSLFPMHLAQLSFYAIVLWACLEASYDTKCISTLNY